MTEFDEKGVTRVAQEAWQLATHNHLKKKTFFGGWGGVALWHAGS